MTDGEKKERMVGVREMVWLGRLDFFRLKTNWNCPTDGWIVETKICKSNSNVNLNPKPIG